MSQYIRKDKNKQGKVYYWLVEGHREGERVVQKRQKYLGTKKPTLAEAIRSYALGSKGAVRAKKEKKTITDRKPARPEVVTTTEDDDVMDWLFG